MAVILLQMGEEGQFISGLFWANYCFFEKWQYFRPVLIRVLLSIFSSNLLILMKKTVTCLSFSANRVTGRVLFPMLVFVFFAATAFGQSQDFKEEIGDLSSKEWKSSGSIDATVAEENARLATILGQLDVQPEDRSLFLAYQRLLGYVQSATQAGNPVNDAIIASYEKVLAEVPHDTALKNMPEGSLMTLMPGLVEMLSAIPMPEIHTGQ